MGNVKLNDEKDYKNFGDDVGKILYAGKAPYRIENFFKSLCKDLPEHCEAKYMKNIVDHLTNMHKAQVKKEKEDRDKKKKGGNKAKLAGGGAKNYDRNNNAAMINDVMGDYGDYGDETGGGTTFKREAEAEYDFM